MTHDSVRLYLPGNPRVVAIGGGHGLSTMLRGLKSFTRNITAIVTVADDGGGSGTLRQELGMPPPGDIRNCIQALSNVEPLMAQLLDYRFCDGSLKGQSFGNLFLAAMTGLSDRFDQAVERMCQVAKQLGIPSIELGPPETWATRRSRTRRAPTRAPASGRRCPA